FSDLLYCNLKAELDLCGGMLQDITPVAHGNVLINSNVMLEDNMVPRLSDFGSAKMLNQEPSKWTRVTGSYGYTHQNFDFLNDPLLGTTFEELKKLFEATPLFRDKLNFSTLNNSRLQTLINKKFSRMVHRHEETSNDNSLLNFDP
ncbi:MDIS1-interacting receptor like kinase 2-like protein, partial [Tanacetum coccineum]